MKITSAVVESFYDNPETQLQGLRETEFTVESGSLRSNYRDSALRRDTRIILEEMLGIVIDENQASLKTVCLYPGLHDSLETRPDYEEDSWLALLPLGMDADVSVIVQFGAGSNVSSVNIGNNELLAIRYSEKAKTSPRVTAHIQKELYLKVFSFKERGLKLLERVRRRIAEPSKNTVPQIMISNENRSSIEYFEIYGWDQEKSLERYPLMPRLGHDAPRNRIFFMVSKIKNADYINKELEELVLKIEKEMLEQTEPGESSDGGTGLGAKSLTSRFQKFNVLSYNHRAVRELEKFFRQSYAEYMQRSHLSRFTVYVQCWANVLRKEQHVGKHRHCTSSLSFLSGNYCVTTQETTTNYYTASDDAEPYRFPNIGGKLIIFPSFLPHESSVYKGDNNRVTIAFDLSIEKALEISSDRIFRLFDIS